jgi:penicillin amidase
MIPLLTFYDLKYISFIAIFLLTFSWVYFLNNQLAALPLIGGMIAESSLSSFPPLGKLFDPFGGAWQNAEPPLPDIADKVVLSQLTAPVRVVYDDRLVPHIFAQNDHDLYFVQGYIAANLRLWQMEFITYAAAGRLSEILGKKMLHYDQMQRRKGMVFAAENAVKEMSKTENSKEMVMAYTDGVNAYINQLSPQELPLEYKVLDYKPEIWTPIKCGLLLKSMAEDLTGYDIDFEMTNAYKIFDKKTFELIYPDFVRGQDPIVPPSYPYDFVPNSTPDAPPTIMASLGQYADTSIHKKIAEPTTKTKKNQKENIPAKADSLDLSSLNRPTPLPAASTNIAQEPIALIDMDGLVKIKADPYRPDPNNGSNNWATMPEKTNTGTAMLCNDPHLKLQLPAIWCEMQLHTPEMNVYGVSLPGSPGITIGFNDSIAWGMTNAQRDVMDWYQISFKNSSKNQYFFDGEWRNTNKRIENFKVRHQAATYDTVTYTHYGPVVYEKNDTQKYNLAMRWVAHDPSNELVTVYRLNRARGYGDYLNAIRYFDCPGQNFVFADIKGNVALWQQGRFVNKWEQQGKFILDGANPEHAWQNFIPKRHSPHVYNPPRGYVSSANQHPTDTSYFYYYNGNFEFFRNRRINQQLSHKERIKPNDMMRLQNDNYNLMAAETLPLMLSYIDERSLNDSTEFKYYQLLSKWNYLNEADSISPAIYETFWKQLYYHVWDEIRKYPNIPLPAPKYYITVQLLSAQPEHALMDIDSTQNKVETAADLVRMSFKETAARLSTWQKTHKKNLNWANYKSTEINHILRIPAFSVANVHTGGNTGIVNATSRTHGPSWRMVVSVDKPMEAYGIYPGGQSGNPGSHFYANNIDKWAEGKYDTLHFWQNPTETDHLLTVQTFVPQ